MREELIWFGLAVLVAVAIWIAWDGVSRTEAARACALARGGTGQPGDPVFDACWLEVAHAR